MDSPRLGFVPTLRAASGGTYQYSRSMFEALDAICTGDDSKPLALVHRKEMTAAREMQRRGWELLPLDSPLSLHRLRPVLGRALGGSRSYQRLRANRAEALTSRPQGMVGPGSSLGRALERRAVEMLLLTAPHWLAFEVSTPSIMAVHDLQHRVQPHWPELSERGQLEAREHIYVNAARRALIWLVDSDVGKEDALNFYSTCGLTEDRVRVLPFLPSPGLRPDRPVDGALPRPLHGIVHKRFVLYPAQFWPHKNHVRLVEALSLLEDREIHLVLCGSDEGSLRRRTHADVMRRAAQLGLGARVHSLGYVSDDTLSALFRQATALVFPTFFGPTNIPISEAWSFGLPVLTSSIRGITEQVGSAAVLVDPTSVESMAEGINRIVRDDALRSSLIQAGYDRLAQYTVDDHRERLGSVLREASQRLLAGGVGRA